MYGPSRLCLPSSSSPPLRPQRARDPVSTREVRGLFSRAQLLARGYGDAQIRRLVGSGRLRCVARGWYATDAAPSEAVRALRLRTRLTCTDALRLHGLWIPEHGAERALHVYGRRTGGPGWPLPRWAHAHRPWVGAWPEPDAVATLPLATRHMLTCRSAECSAIVLESAVNLGAMSCADMQAMLDALPRRVREPIGELSRASDSGSETRVVRWLRRRGFTVEQQVWVEGAGFVDAYVAGIFLELDGREHHSSAEAFEADRRRDLMLRRRGLQLVRLSYGQVWRTWDHTRGALLETIARTGRIGARRAASAGLGPWC